MAVQYTRKKKETTEKTVNAEEFISLMLDNKRLPDARRKEHNTEIKK